MTLIEGVGDEVTNFFIGVLVILIVFIPVSLAWWTTSISEQRHVRTVLLLDRRRHRAHAFRRLTNHTESVTIAGSPMEASSSTNETQNEETALPSIETIPCVSKPPEATTSGEATEEHHETDESNDQNRIIETMDGETFILRQRRLAFYDNWSNVAGESNETAHTGNFAHPSHDLVEEILNDSEPLRIGDDEVDVDGTSTLNEPTTTIPPDADEDSGIRIKLKYMNDDLKLVDGKLQELLGDFKRRHFQPEITSNKLVKLIFNGQVLQQDSQTLQSCGLFDNCVVHCLIHQKRTSPSDGSADNRNENNSSSSDNRIPNFNNNNQPREWDFGNSLFAFISVILLAAWYFRYVYAHLYTVTATVGLILITGIFTIVLIGMYFPDNENLANARIHIHTERVPQPQQ